MHNIALNALRTGANSGANNGAATTPTPIAPSSGGKPPTPTPGSARLMLLAGEEIEKDKKRLREKKKMYHWLNAVYQYVKHIVGQMWRGERFSLSSTQTIALGCALYLVWPLIKPSVRHELARIVDSFRRMQERAIDRFAARATTLMAGVGIAVIKSKSSGTDESDGDLGGDGQPGDPDESSGGNNTSSDVASSRATPLSPIKEGDESPSPIGRTPFSTVNVSDIPIQFEAYVRA